MHKPKAPLYHKRWTLRLFEWGVLTCVILVLMGAFLRKVRYLQAEAERLTVQGSIDNMRAAVLLASVLHADSENIRSEARPGGNPVRLLQAETGLELDGYLGELDSADSAEVAAGKWYFDRKQAVLVYRLRSVEGFESPLSGPARIRLCLNNAGANGTMGTSLILEPCEAFTWGPLN
ncbi:type IV pilus minor pilin MshB, putative [Syntrophotalea carbinolica DSM 2380]|uniref:Type IV pilus minor pilin MshB, putative n=1 Tax=Syntrophotalea carbinolica (strain DSM 2380 / NBRC 103641 / GraBd1) TaxID=338963 RepID=Q3A7J4_SYNC1|nr:hypothetical protein [Syntrophotalea carbinolica]ABA87650.1 type IV pilus minor pilin MshB, putative [Syntrophotalea carbinolica DSM 2380]